MTHILKAYNGPAYIHTDLLAIIRCLDIDVRQAFKELKTSNRLFEQAFRLVEEAVGGRDIVVPTYNYDFCQTLTFDPANDVSQVGSFSEYYRKDKAKWRSNTPVFSYAGEKHDLRVEEGEIVDPFSGNSQFAKLIEDNGVFVFIGVPFSCTMLHYCERTFMDGPLYRYDKKFVGNLKQGEEVKPLTLFNHVRPRGLIVKYDLKKQKEDLEKAGILWELPSEFGHSSIASAAEIAEFWQDKLAQDPYYFLTSESRASVEPVVEKYGRRLQAADFNDGDKIMGEVNG